MLLSQMAVQSTAERSIDTHTSCVRFVSSHIRSVQRKVYFEGIVPDSRPLASSVLFEVDQMERFEFFEVGVDLMDVPIDESCRLANTRWLVLYDRPKQFQIFRASDTVDVVWIVEDHLQMGVWCLTMIECTKGIS